MLSYAVVCWRYATAWGPSTFIKTLSESEEEEEEEEEEREEAGKEDEASAR